MDKKEILENLLKDIHSLQTTFSKWSPSEDYKNDSEAIKNLAEAYKILKEDK